MAALRTYWSDHLTPWLRYAGGIAALSGLLIPRAASWGRRLWVQSRPGQRRILAQAAASTASAA